MRDFINENETIEEKEEYQLYVWNKKKEKVCSNRQSSTKSLSL